MKILLAPGAVADEATDASAAATRQERPMSGWMNAIGDLDTPLNDTPPPKKEDKPNASTNDTGGRSAVVPPADKLPAVDDAAAKAKADTEAKEKAEAARLATEKAAAEAAAKLGDKTSDDADEKWPKNSADWDKFKTKRAAKEAALREEIKTRDTRLKELETKTAEYETKLKATPAVDPELQSKLERLEARNKELTDKITVLDVTQHPDFVSYFERKTKTSLDKAKRIVGEEKAAQAERILTMQDSDYKTLQMEELLADVTDLQRSRLAVVIDELENTNLERANEIAAANEHKTTLLTEGAAKAKASAEQRQKLMQDTFNDVTKAIQDPKNGNPMFQLREGDDAWNAEVPKRIESVKSLLLSNNLKPESVVRAAYNAIALPVVLQHYQADSKAWSEEKAKLEAQVKALTAAQPGAGGTGGGGTVEDKLPADTNPHDRAKAWAAKMVKSVNEMT